MNGNAFKILAGRPEEKYVLENLIVLVDVRTFFLN
jgi:hypothetical protein